MVLLGDKNLSITLQHAVVGVIRSFTFVLGHSRCDAIGTVVHLSFLYAEQRCVEVHILLGVVELIKGGGDLG